MITQLKYKLKIAAINFALWHVKLLRRWLFVLDMWRRIRAWDPSVIRNIWIYHPDIAIYIRIAMRYRNDTYVMSLDLASVEVSEHAQRKRRFADTLHLLEGFARVRGYHRVTVENVHNPVLVDALRRRGYVDDVLPGGIVSGMYKTITHAKISADNRSGRDNHSGSDGSGHGDDGNVLAMRRRMRGGR